MNANDYHFYDANDANIETRGLLGIDAEYVNEEPKTAQIGLYGGALATLLLLVISILSWILFHKNRGKIILAHAIISTIGLLIAAFTTVWALGAQKGLRSNVSPNPLMTLIAFSGCLLLSAYFFVAAVFLWVYRDFYLNYMYVVRSNQKDWDKYFWNYDFNRAKIEDWRILLSIVIMSVVVALVLALLSYAAYCFLKNKIQTSKIILLIGLVGVTVFSFLALIWVIDNKIHYNLIKSHFKHFNGDLYLWILVCGIVALSLAFINAILNLIRFRASSLIFGALWIGFAALLIVLLGLLYRDIGRFSKTKPIDCRDTSDFIHENNYRTFCPNKYLANGRTCRKQDLVVRWEAGSKQFASLNPACCQVSNDLTIWPVYVLAIWGLFLVVFMFISAIGNLSLTNQDLVFDDTFKSINIVDIITVGVIVLLGLGLGLFLIFRTIPLTKNRNFAGRQGFDTKADGSLVPKSGFVQMKETDNSSQLPDKCFSLDITVLPTNIVDKTTCTSNNCGLSTGLYVTNGYFNVDAFSGNAKQGPKSYRQFFFPEGKNAHDDFLHLFGTESDVHESLRSISVCHNNILVGVNLYLNVFQTDLNKIDDNSLTRNVTPIYSAPIDNGPRPDFLTYTKVPATCKESCTQVLVDNSLQLLNLVGNLLIKDKDGAYISYGVPEVDLDVIFVIRENDKRKIIGYGAYDAQGLLKIPVQALRNTSYQGTVEIRDRAWHYLPTDIDVAVTYGGPNKDIDIGQIILTTISGKGCKDINDLKGTDACFTKQTLTSYHLKIKVEDPETGSFPHHSATYKILKTHSRNGEQVSSGTFTNGTATVNLHAGYYTILFDADTYSQIALKTTLDSDKELNALLTKADSKSFRIYMDVDNTNTTDDYDLHLKISTINGQECTVSPFNRICPYARHIRDVKSKEKGHEIIEINNFVKAYYMVYVTKSPSYDGGCAEVNVLNKRLLSNFGLSHALFGFVNIGNDFRVYTSGLGSNGLDPILDTGTNNFIDRSKEPFNPIKYGATPITENILTSLNEKIKPNGPKPSIMDLMNKVVKSPNQIDDFMYSLPKLYTPEEIEKELDSPAKLLTVNTELSKDIQQDLNILKDKKYNIPENQLEYGISDSLRQEHEKLNQARSETSGVANDELITFEKEKEILGMSYKDAPIVVTTKEIIEPLIIIPKPKVDDSGECLECVELKEEPDRIIDEDYKQGQYPGVESLPIGDNDNERDNTHSYKTSENLESVLSSNIIGTATVAVEDDPLDEKEPVEISKIAQQEEQSIQSPVEEPKTEIVVKNPEPTTILTSDVNAQIATIATPTIKEANIPTKEENDQNNAHPPQPISKPVLEQSALQPLISDIQQDVANKPVEVQKEPIPEQTASQPLISDIHQDVANKPVEIQNELASEKPITQPLISDIHQDVANKPVLVPNELASEKPVTQPLTSDIHQDVANKPVEVQQEPLLEQPVDVVEEPIPEEPAVEEQTETQSNAGMMLDANIRRLADQKNTYIIQFCFTGYGQKSIKQLLKTYDSEPSIEVCKALYPKDTFHGNENSTNL